jgi:hypothetical protein
MCFVPGRIEYVVIPAAPYTAPAREPQTPDYVLLAWAGGVILSLVVLMQRQLRFVRALGRLRSRVDLGAQVRVAESATLGPAVLGVLRPVIVTPADFETRFNAEERGIVLAHERAHLAHGDPWINATVVLLQCINWFNPLVHVAARALRIDQELACDAAVLARSEGARRRYAEAMLKTHVGAAAPLGCAWPPHDLTSFKERIAMLKCNPPSRTQILFGGAAIAALTAAAAAAALAAQPARVIPAFASEQPSQLAAPLDASGRLELVRLDGDGEDVSDNEDALDGEDLPDDEVLLGEDIFAGGDDGQFRYYRDGVLIDANNLSPEEREAIRASIAEARAAMDEAREAMREAMQEAREAGEDMSSHEAEVAAAQLAMEEARAALAATREARAAAIVEAREAVRAAQAIDVERVQAAALASAEVQAAIAAAQVEIAQALAEARSEGDARRTRSLERAERDLDRADALDEH